MKISLIFYVLILVSINMIAILPVHAQTLSFSPSRIFFKGNPGETVTEFVTIFNSGKEAYEFISHVEDWKRDSLGNKLYFPLGTLASSNARYAAVDESSFVVPSGTQKKIAIRFTIPKEGIQKTTNSMLFFTQTNAIESNKGNQSGVGIKASLELGIQLFYTPYGTAQGDFKFLAFKTRDSIVNNQKKLWLAVKFENTGCINKDAFLRFELTNKKTGKEIKLPIIPIAIMPSDFQWIYSWVAEEMEEGEYLGVAILDSGGLYNLKVAEKNIYVKK